MQQRNEFREVLGVARTMYMPPTKTLRIQKPVTTSVAFEKPSPSSKSRASTRIFADVRINTKPTIAAPKR